MLGNLSVSLELNVETRKNKFIMSKFRGMLLKQIRLCKVKGVQIFLIFLYMIIWTTTLCYTVCR